MWQVSCDEITNIHLDSRSRPEIAGIRLDSRSRPYHQCGHEDKGLGLVILTLIDWLSLEQTEMWSESRLLICQDLAIQV